MQSNSNKKGITTSHFKREMKKGQIMEVFEIRGRLMAFNSLFQSSLDTHDLPVHLQQVLAESIVTCVSQS